MAGLGLTFGFMCHPFLSFGYKDDEFERAKSGVEIGR